MKVREIPKSSRTDAVYYSVVVGDSIQTSETEILANYFIGDFDILFQKNQTILQGQIKDQVALFGLLNYLSDLQYVLLGVNKLSDNNDFLKL